MKLGTEGQGRDPRPLPRILIVDDEPRERQAMCSVLKNLCQLDTAASGDAAVEKVRGGNDYDVISLDIQMPGISGVEALAAIKATHPEIEVLLVTGHVSFDAARQSLQAGAYDYIEKPIQPERLREAIQRGVERRTKTRAAQHAQEELKVLKAELSHTQKLSVIGETLASFAHELRNPLSAIIGYAELIAENSNTEEGTRDKARVILQSGELCDGLIARLVGFARKGPLTREPVALATVINDALKLKTPDLSRSGVVVTTEWPEPFVSVLGDPSQILQVFLNLVTNAGHAMEQTAGERSLTVSGEVSAGVVRVSFTDTGQGIPPEVQARIFEPFFTTKEKEHGTGLGLSICYDLVKDHGGDLYVSSEVGQGTCFFVEFPEHLEA